MTKAVSRRELLGLAGAVLAGCAFPNQRIVDSSGFGNSACSFLTEELKRKGLHNLDSPLFDFSDEEVREAYSRAVKRGGMIHNRDFEGKDKIETAAEGHLYTYGDRALILISAAAFHIYGAVEALEERFNAGYISMTPKKLKFSDVLEHNKMFGYTAEFELDKARETLEIQMRRANGASIRFGYRDLFDFVEKVSSFRYAKNIAVGIEETGLHDLYTEKETRQVYKILGSFVERFRPSSILFFTEGEVFDGDRGRTGFLAKVESLRIPVEIAGF